MTYESIVSSILKVGEHNTKQDYWKEQAEIPLFSKKPFDDYDREIPIDDIITMKIDTRGAQQRNPLNGLLCASAGVGKTRLVKNIVKGFHKQETNILMFEPKSNEMMNASKIGKGRRLAPGDFNEKLPIVVYCPNYIKLFLEKNFPAMVHKVKFYSPDISKMDYPEIWQSFGIPVKIAAFIVELIQKGVTDLEKIKNSLPKMHTTTFQAVDTAISSLQASKFFGAKQKSIPLEEEWKKGNIVIVEYFSRDGAMMNTDIGLDLDYIRDIGIRESEHGLNNVTKKLIIFDDAFYYAGISATMATRATGGTNLAIRNIANCQNNFRTWGIDTFFIVQSPDNNAIYSALIDGCTTKLVSYVENPNALQGKLPYNAYNLIANVDPRYPMLHVDEENYVFQWIYCKGKTKWATGYPFDISVGHT